MAWMRKSAKRCSPPWRRSCRQSAPASPKTSPTRFSMPPLRRSRQAPPSPWTAAVRSADALASLHRHQRDEVTQAVVTIVPGPLHGGDGLVAGGPGLVVQQHLDLALAVADVAVEHANAVHVVGQRGGGDGSLEGGQAVLGNLHGRVLLATQREVADVGVEAMHAGGHLAHGQLALVHRVPARRQYHVEIVAGEAGQRIAAAGLASTDAAETLLDGAFLVEHDVEVEAAHAALLAFVPDATQGRVVVAFG